MCASAVSFLDGKICAIQEPFIITIITKHQRQTNDDEVVERFYEQLDNITTKIPDKDILVVSGDSNALTHTTIWHDSRQI